MNTELPAFPLDRESEKAIIEGYGHQRSGLTKREYAAIHIAGQLAHAFAEFHRAHADVVATQAVQYADELLKKLDSTKP